MNRVKDILITNFIGGSLELKYDENNTFSATPNNTRIPLLTYYLDEEKGMSDKVLLLTADSPQQHLVYKRLINVVILDMRDDDFMYVYIIDSLTRYVIECKVNRNNKCVYQRYIQTEYPKHEIEKLIGYSTESINMDDVNGHLHIYNMITTKGLILVKGVSDNVKLLL